MQIRNEPGELGEKDRVVLVRAIYWEKMKYKDLYEIVRLLADNEERLYPQEEGKRGRKFLRDFLHHALEGKELTQDIKDAFNL